MRSELGQVDPHKADTEGLYARTMAEWREMAWELDRLKEQIAHTARQAIERSLIKANLQ